MTNRGEPVNIFHPGQWNQGPGPDFRDAEWAIGGRRYQGDIEIHVHPIDWVHHHHGQDDRYREVRLHVTYHPGELPVGTLPTGCEEVSLKASLDQRSHFFFESVDIHSYPWDQEAAQSGIREWLQHQSEETCTQLLEAAGHERLRRKTQKMLSLIQSVGSEQALYQVLMRGLGYDRNADATEKLARTLPLSRLRHYTDSDPLHMYAALLGSAGLLPNDEPGKAYPDWFSLRSLWDVWWRIREGIGETYTSENAWKFVQCRPGNHPARRLWAISQWYSTQQNPAEFWSPGSEESTRKWIQRISHTLQVLDPDQATQVIGPGRASALLFNAVLPWRLACFQAPPETDWWKFLPAEPMNTKSKRAFHAFFGRDAHPRICRGSLRRQGLLQLAEDYGV